MRKGLTLALCALALLAACAAPGIEKGGASSSQVPAAAPEPDELFALLPKLFTFSSGVGGWATELSIEADGAFSGRYVDTDMGDSGDGYPCGTRYVCSFSGTFSQPEQLDSHTYSTYVENLELEEVPGEVSYGDGFRYVTCEAYGLDDAYEALIYLPGIPVAQLPEEFLSWTSWTSFFWEEEWPEAFPYYGLYNVQGEQGFVSQGQ